MAILIPIPSQNFAGQTDPIFDVQAVLDGVIYTLQFEWNDRASSWFIYVLDGDGVSVLLAGQKVVADYPLGVNSSSRPFPGYLIARDTTGKGDDPGFDDLGDRVVLDYLTAADIAFYVGANPSPLEVVAFVRLLLGH